MQDSILIIDCFDNRHKIKIDDVLDFSTFSKGVKPITIIKLNETFGNGIHKDFRTYENENALRLRYSKIYDELHKED